MKHTGASPEDLIVRTLRTGVGVSFALLLAGFAWTVGLALAGRVPPPTVRDAGGVHGNVMLLLAGLLVLMATPILRILAAWHAFSREGDRRFARLALAVLAIVLASTAVGVVQKGLLER